MAEATPHMTDKTPEDLRRDIASTRDDLGHTVDAIEDRVHPGRIYERRTQRMRAAVTRLRESVMGSDGPGVSDRASGAVSEAAHAVGHAPEAAREQARGNPLAAGLVAFGTGLLAASLFPESDTEQRVAGEVAARLEPMKGHVAEAAREVGHEIGDAARDAVEHTKEAAADAAQETRDDVRDTADEARGSQGGSVPHSGA